jgi:hypothetical protein
MRVAAAAIVCRQPGLGNIVHEEGHSVLRRLFKPASQSHASFSGSLLAASHAAGAATYTLISNSRAGPACIKHAQQTGLAIPGEPDSSVERSDALRSRYGHQRRQRACTGRPPESCDTAQPPPCAAKNLLSMPATHQFRLSTLPNRHLRRAKSPVLRAWLGQRLVTGPWKPC